MIYTTYISSFTAIRLIERMLLVFKQGNFNYNHPVYLKKKKKNLFYHIQFSDQNAFYSILFLELNDKRSLTQDKVNPHLDTEKNN